jgi:hypothetical protein
MAIPISGSAASCSKCGCSLSPAMRHCPTCRADAGAPNVRACRTAENSKALRVRFDVSRDRSKALGCSKEFVDLEGLLKEKSGVVVSMNAGMARKLVEDPNSIYENYEQLVGASQRRPADFDNDRQRCIVGATLFGSYADLIVYGALSLNETGVPTYGSVHCRIRSVAISERTTFLETNSYGFVREHRVVAGDRLPIGYTSSWDDRHLLVLAKLADSLCAGQSESDWQAILIRSDGKDRQKDDFVEAHIYENFDINAVECMVTSTGKKLSRTEQIDSKLAIDGFKRRAGKA